jgi:hypothetical protein
MIATPIPLTKEGLSEVAGNIRSIDREEIAALMPADWDGDMDRWSHAMCKLPGDKFLFCDQDERAIAAGGFVWESESSSFVVWLIATNHFPRVVSEVHEFFQGYHERLKDQGVKRFEASCLESHSEYKAWLDRLGYRCIKRKPLGSMQEQMLSIWERTED